MSIIEAETPMNLPGYEDGQATIEAVDTGRIFTYRHQSGETHSGNVVDMHQACSAMGKLSLKHAFLMAEAMEMGQRLLEEQQEETDEPDPTKDDAPENEAAVKKAETKKLEKPSGKNPNIAANRRLLEHGSKTVEPTQSAELYSLTSNTLPFMSLEKEEVIQAPPARITKKPGESKQPDQNVFVQVEVRQEAADIEPMQPAAASKPGTREKSPPPGHLLQAAESEPASQKPAGRIASDTETKNPVITSSGLVEAVGYFPAIGLTPDTYLQPDRLKGREGAEPEEVSVGFWEHAKPDELKPGEAAVEPSETNAAYDHPLTVELLADLEVQNIITLAAEAQAEAVDVEYRAGLYAWEDKFEAFAESGSPEHNTIVKEIEYVVEDIAEKIMFLEPDKAQSVYRILDRIVAIPAELKATAVEGLSVQEEAKEELAELFTSLFEVLEMEYNPRLLEFFIKTTLDSDGIQVHETAEPALPEFEELSRIYGTHEFIKRIRQNTTLFKQAAVQAYLVGKSVLKLYGPTRPQIV